MGYTPHVVVIGGGAVGTGVARDLAIRGFDVTVLERGTLASGSTGRAEGLLASGAHLAASDPRMARFCHEERTTLETIASHCIEETGGFVVAGGDVSALDDLEEACSECDIPVTSVPSNQLDEMEPALADTVERALITSDAVVDPFRLTVATARDAQDYGAEIRTHTEVTNVLVEDGSVRGVEVHQDPTPTGFRLNDQNESVDDSGGENEPTTADDGEAEPTTEGDGDEQATENEGEDVTDDGDDRTDVSGGDGNAGESDDADEPETTDRNAPVAGRDPVKLEGQTTEGQIPGASSDDSDGSDGASGPSSPREHGRTETIDADYVVNAAGARADRIMALADLPMSLERTPSVRAIGEECVLERPVSVLPAEESAETSSPVDELANTVVPYGGHTVLGTETHAETRERAIDDLVRSVSDVVPDLRTTRLLRSFETAVYSLSGYGKPAVHGHEFVLIDHANHHDCWGMTTVLGGSVTTHRLAAEHVADQVCSKFGISRECQTAELSLPGSDDESLLIDETHFDPEKAFGLSEELFERSKARLGSRAGTVLDTDGENPVVCECQSVTRSEVLDAIEDGTGNSQDLTEVRIRTSATMGSCQGGRCAHRLANLLYRDYDRETAEDALAALLQERWHNQCLWGEQLGVAARNYRLHTTILNRTHQPPDELALEAFDGGPDYAGTFDGDSDDAGASDSPDDTEADDSGPGEAVQPGSSQPGTTREPGHGGTAGFTPSSATGIRRPSTADPSGSDTGRFVSEKPREDSQEEDSTAASEESTEKTETEGTDDIQPGGESATDESGDESFDASGDRRGDGDE